MTANDERVCQKHEGGRHCWHFDKTRSKGYKGKYETYVPVECCHCKRTGTKLEHAADGVTYD